jgi:hypothetical protein
MSKENSNEDVLKAIENLGKKVEGIDAAVKALEKKSEKVEKDEETTDDQGSEGTDQGGAAGTTDQGGEGQDGGASGVDKSKEQGGSDNKEVLNALDNITKLVTDLGTRVDKVEKARNVSNNVNKDEGSGGDEGASDKKNIFKGVF